MRRVHRRARVAPSRPDQHDTRARQSAHPPGPDARRRRRDHGPHLDAPLGRCRGLGPHRSGARSRRRPRVAARRRLACERPLRRTRGRRARARHDLVLAPPRAGPARQVPRWTRAVHADDPGGRSCPHALRLRLLRPLLQRSRATDLACHRRRAARRLPLARRQRLCGHRRSRGARGGGPPPARRRLARAPAPLHAAVRDLGRPTTSG